MNVTFRQTLTYNPELMLVILISYGITSKSDKFSWARSDDDFANFLAI